MELRFGQPADGGGRDGRMDGVVEMPALPETARQVMRGCRTWIIAAPIRGMESGRVPPTPRLR